LTPKADTTVWTFRIPTWLLRTIKRFAVMEKRKTTDYVRIVLEDHVKQKSLKEE
jgi:hypothetical protein